MARQTQYATPRLVWVMVALVSATVAGIIGWAFTGDSLAVLGIPDPGILTTVGVPVVRSIAYIIATIAVGNFLMAAFGAPPRRDGSMDVDGYHASRTGAWAMLLLAILSVLLVFMYLSDISGQPLSTVLNRDGWTVATNQVLISQGWRWVAIIAAIVWLLSFNTRRWIWQPLFLALSLIALVPLANNGHSSSGGNHDYGVNTLLWHISFTTLWVGGLMALIAYGLRRGPYLATIVRRYSFLAAFSIAVLAISGMINALLRLTPNDLITTGYGRVLALKLVCILALAVIGWRHRSRIIPSLEDSPAGAPGNPQARAAFIRLAVVEVAVMAATIGVAVSLGRIPPPLDANPNLTSQDILLGFTLTEAPSLGAYLTQWRFDLVFGTVALLLQAVYVWAFLHLRKAGHAWPVQRLVWWTLGNVGLFVATSSGLGMYAMAMFGPHMLQHMVLSMFIPVCWALGGPMTLLLRALPAAGRDGVPGPREWIVVFINNPVSRFLTHPVVASVQFVVGFYYLYLSNLYAWMAPEHLGHLFMLLHFLISGYIFYWVIIGVDAAPRHFSPFIKMLALFGVVVFHAWFGIAMMQMSTPLAEDFYRQLDLPFAVDLAEQQKLGGAITWAIGEIPLLIVSVAHGLQWLQQDRREAARHDRKEERNHDAELEAYNAMLAGLGEGSEDAGKAAYYKEEFSPRSDDSERPQPRKRPH